MGTTTGITQGLPTIVSKLDDEVNYLEGCVNDHGNIIGTYIHGIFDDADFTRALINSLRENKGLDKVENTISSFDDFKNNEYDKLANILRESLDIEKIYEIING